MNKQQLNHLKQTREVCELLEMHTTLSAAGLCDSSEILVKTNIYNVCRHALQLGLITVVENTGGKYNPIRYQVVGNWRELLVSPEQPTRKEIAQEEEKPSIWAKFRSVFDYGLPVL